MLGIRTHGLPVMLLPQVASCIAGEAEVAPGFVPGAAAVLWHDGDTVWLRETGEPDLELHPGDRFEVEGRPYWIEELSLEAAGILSTIEAPARAPVRIKLSYDSVDLQQGEAHFAIHGIPAKIISELADFGTPADWRTVAGEIWPQETDPFLLRKNWDAGLGRLRRLLLDGGIRRDLVRQAGRGRVELFLYPGDTIDDQQ
jgi:hypothetical protein